MQEEISFIDLIGIASFIWSIITFYIGYRWYKDGATKDALIARLTAEAEILRKEIAAISSADGGQKQEKLAIRRVWIGIN